MPAGPRVATALAALVLAVPGCAAPAPAPSVAASAGPLEWRDCSYGECATLTVPLDHADPAAGTLDLAVSRVRATQQPALGTLLVNPGGPGASGRAFAASFPRAGLERYDIVGWDPRGVGASAPVVCADAAGTDAYLALDNSPDSPAEVDALVAGTGAYAEACRAHTGALLDRLSVADTARDLDLLRRALGDAPLVYYGASYGTAIGAAYAALFPGTVGRLVLDAGVDPRRPPAVPQAAGFEAALDAFATWCAAEGCPLGRAAAARVAALLDRLDAAPLEVDGRPLTQTLATTGLVTLLGGGEGAWPAVAEAVAAAESGDGAVLLGAADATSGRRRDGSYTGAVAAFTATYCADDDIRTPARAANRWGAERAQAPVFGEAMGAPWLCVGWTATPADPLPLPADPAGEVLVVGGRGDPVTPYAWSRELAASLTGAALLTAPGHGHVAYGRGSACVDDAVRGILVDGTLPAAGSTCR